MILARLTLRHRWLRIKANAGYMNVLIRIHQSYKSFLGRNEFTGVLVSDLLSI
jgi:hypothetical protein